MPFLLSGGSVVLGTAMNLLFVRKNKIRRTAASPLSLQPCGRNTRQRVLRFSLLSHGSPVVPPARVISAIAACHLLLGFVSSCRREQPWKAWSGPSVLSGVRMSTPLSKRAPRVSFARRPADAKLTVSLRLTKAIAERGCFFLLFSLDKYRGVFFPYR